MKKQDVIIIHIVAKEKDTIIANLEKTIKDLNDKFNKTVANYEKVIKEKDTVINNLEKTVKDLNDKLNKTVAQYEKTIKDLTDKYNKALLEQIEANKKIRSKNSIDNKKYNLKI